MTEQELYIKLLQSDYCEYCKFVHNGEWQVTRFHKYLTNYVQEFIERDTDNAYDILCIHTPPQFGKLIADYTPVLTKDGWKRHGDLVIGDYVFGLDGEYKKVINVLPKHYANMTVELTNGQRIECHENHEWVVYDRNSHKNSTIETVKMFNRGVSNKLLGRGHRYNFMLPNAKPIKGTKKDLLVNPYVLGAWLGDGTNTKQCICSCKKDIIVLDECSKYYTTSSENVHKDTGVITRYYKNLNKDLRTFGMCFSKKTEKYIPEEYITSSIEQRLELLAGLIDTDGYLDKKHNRVAFTTSDYLLKETFERLISTFGWRVSTTEVQPRLSTSGIQGKKAYWQICFNPTISIPCRIERKKQNKFSKQRRIAIKNIYYSEHTVGNCITVEDGIYLVGRTMIPTHNSMTITETLPSWFLGRNPDKKVIEISYNEDFARIFGIRNRQKIKEYGDAIFGVGISRERDTALAFELEGHRGGMISSGAGTGVTGKQSHLMVIDDPIKNSSEANSQLKRDSIYDEWITSFRSRLWVGAKVIVIMTRWHEDDLVGRMLEEENNIEYLCLPCEAEENDAMGREIGDALCPEIGKGNEWLKDFKEVFSSKTGVRTWNALYQGRPTAQEGNLIERQWWSEYEELPEIASWLMSVDATFKDSKDNDFVAIQVWGKAGANYYLIDAIKKRLNFPDTVREIRRLRGMYTKCKTTLIEDKANGSAIIQMLRHEMSGIIPVVTLGSKTARVEAILGTIESGNVYLPKKKSFTNDFIDECASFPNGKHDDQVDCMSMSLNRLVYRRGVGNKQERELTAMEKMFPAYFGRNKNKEGKINVI